MRRGATVSGTGAVLALGLALAGCTAGSVEVPPPDPEGQAADQCRALVKRVPSALFGENRVEVSPRSDFAAAWGDPPIALRCGVDRPAGLRPDSELMVVNDIAWLPEPEDRPNLFTVVGREAYVEMSVPPSYGAPAEGLVAISDLVADEIPALPDGEL
ncbi:DUF3515 domain-containing protein [Nocardiopsis mwathae]|nr:DUF3515 domain-containing protein [Nocardiopsis mwathae]